MISLLRHGARLWQTAGAQFPYITKTVDLAWGASRRWTLLWLTLLLVQGLLPVASVYLIRELVDALAAVVGAGIASDALRPALLYVALLAGITLLSHVLAGFLSWVRAAQAELIQDEISALIQQKSSSVDLAFYESAEFYDHLHRARDEGSHRPLALLESLGSLAQNAVTLLAMAAVLVPYGWWIPLALLAATLPAMWVVLRASIRRHRWRVQVTPVQRRARYYDWALTSAPFAIELRLYGLADFFRDRFRHLRKGLRDENLRLSREQAWAELLAGSAAVLITGATMAWMVWRAVLGAVTLGDVALFYQAFQRGLGMTQSLLKNAGEVYSNSLYLSNLYEFLALAPQVTAPPSPRRVPSLQQAIQFENVTFRYPGARSPVFENLNLSLPAGHRVALVGPNGAGKSTITKLLCRLYDPEAGRITLDGVDIRELDPAELRRHIAVLCQEPVHYNETAATNIAQGDVSADPHQPRIQTAANAAGADAVINRLAGGYDQLLGKEFLQGAELSVGEWQRIGLARAAYREAPLLILDEPTSAMDPWAEAEWGRRFRTWTAGRTAILITHRFTTAMFADEIHVLENGRVIESGAHQDLINNGGRYAQAWRR